MNNKFEMRPPSFCAKSLAEYGIAGAGGDEDAGQQEFGAECVESAIYLMRYAGMSEVSVCGQTMTQADLTEKVREMRAKAEDLRKKV